MPTVNIGGRRVRVDDSFMSMSPADQQATVDEIEASLGPAPQTAAPAAPELPSSLPAPEIPPTGQLLSRKAMRDPTWPEPQGVAAEPPPTESLGVPLSEGDWLASLTPPATAFPNPPGQFTTPENAMPYTPPPETPAELGVPSEFGMGTPTMDPNAPVTDPSRVGKIALQKGLSGLTDFATLPVTIPQLGMAGAQWGVEKFGDLVDKYAVAPLLGRAPRTTEDLRDQGIIPEKDRFLSQIIKDNASSLANKAGYQEVTPDTFGEKLFGNAVQLATEGGVTGGVLSRLARGPMAAVAAPSSAASTRVTKFLTPYAEQPAKTVFGDTLAGGGAGVGQTGSQYLPEDFRKAGGGTVGALSDLMLMGAGGVSGGQAASSLTGAPGLIGKAVSRNRPAEGFSVDPITGATVSNEIADKTAAFVQSVMAQNPRVTAQEIKDAVKSFQDQGLPVPTTGLLPTGDSALAGLEKRQRTQAGTGPTQLDPNAPDDVRKNWSFFERDQALRDAATKNVQSTLPKPQKEVRTRAGTKTAEEAQAEFDSEFQRRAAERMAMQEQQAQREIDQPVGRERRVEQARAVEAEPVQSVTNQQAADASRNIHSVYEQSRKLEQEQRTALFKDPAWADSKVDITPLQKAAKGVNLESSLLTPVAAQAKTIIARVFDQLEAGKFVNGKHLSDFNYDVEKLLTLSKDDGRLFNELKSLKDAVKSSIDLLPESHAGRQAIEEAYRHQTGVTQPQFRQYASGQLDRDLKTNSGQVYPEKTGGKFLATGSDADQLMSIANRVGQGPFTAAQARTVLFDEMVKNGIVKDGVIDADALVKWRNGRNDTINRIPNLGDEINTMISAARSGEDLAGRYATQIKRAEANAAKTKTDFAQSPASKIQDKTPEEAVSSIMNGPNAAKNMAQLRKDMGNNPKADESLRAAVSRYFESKVKTVDVFNESEVGTRASSLQKEFDKHRQTLVAAGYSPEQMQALQRAQTVMKPLLRRNIQATTGSTTAESSEAALRPLELALKGYYGILKGGGVFRTIKVGLKTLRGNDSDLVDALVTRMMFDPDLAQALLTRDVKKAGGAAWNANLQKALRRVEAGRDLAHQDDREEPDDPAAKTPLPAGVR